ncbi:MAG: hypothetical protein JNK34_04315 [Tabrizicola sp.]|nr:hypothetical protein [Tabrizicola sp.]
MRPLGYTPDEARAFLAALSAPGRVFYQTVQHRLDLAFPGLLALSLSLAYSRLAPRRLAQALTAIVIAAACLDWAENAAVARLLGAVAPEDAMILAASRLTAMKSLCAAVGIAALLGLLVRKVWRS